MSKLSIFSDGTVQGTHVLLDGQRLDRVVAVEWQADAKTDKVYATLLCLDVHTDVALNVLAPDAEPVTKDKGIIATDLFKAAGHICGLCKKPTRGAPLCWDCLHPEEFDK